MGGSNYMEEPDAGNGQPVIESTATHAGDQQQPPPGTGYAAPPPQQPVSQAITRAADGGVIPANTRTAGNFVDLLEDGQLSADMHEQLAELAAQISAVANTTGAKTKGQLTLVVKLEKHGREDPFHIQADVKVKAPDLPRRRSIMWADGGSFTRFPPNQTQMFGTAPIRRV